MKAILCKQYGPPDSLVFEDLPSPTPGRGEVVVSVNAASINFPDVLIIENKYPLNPPLPFSPRSELPGASSRGKLGVCRAHGADEGIAYASGRGAGAPGVGEYLRERIKALTADKGPDVIYDAVGGQYTEPALRSIAWRGRLLVVGFAAGEIPKIPLNLTLLKGCSIVGVYWGDFARREPDRFAASIRQLGAWDAKGKLKPHMAATFPLARAADALALMAARKVTGKVVLTV